MALVVSTTADEQDASASPSSPGQTGFSLREALLFANNQAGSETITFSVSSKLVLTSALPSITGGVTINGAAELDANSIPTNTPCITVTASAVTLDSLTLYGCKGEPVRFTNTATGGTLSNTTLYSNARGVTAYANDVILFFNGIQTTSGAAISVFGQRAQVLANWINDPPGAGIAITDGANAAYLLANVIMSAGTGISLANITGVTVWHNTIVGTGGHGINAGSASQVDLRNNIITGSSQYGVLASSGQFVVQDYNLFYQNSLGNCSACTTGSHTVSADPKYVDPGKLDYALQAGSPAINAGVDLGVDRTPFDSGTLFNGSAPDIGYVEY